MKLRQVVAGSLRRERGYLSTLVATLGVCAALGGTALALNLMLFFEDLPYPGSEDLYELRIVLVHPDGELSGSAAPAAAVARSAVPGVTGAGYALSSPFRVRSLDQDLQVRGGFVSPEYMALLQPGLAAGESLGEAGRELQATAVISRRLQRMLYPSPQAAVGQLLTAGDTVVEIVGVLEDGYLAPRELAGQPEDLWIGSRSTVDDPAQWSSLSSNAQVLVKVARDVDLGAVEQAAGAAVVDKLRLYNTALLEETQAVAVRLVPLRQAVVGDSDRVGLSFLAAAVALLGVGLSFATFLVVARVGRLRSTLRMHMVLGARRRHLVRLAALEMGLVLVLTTVVGFVVGAVVVWALRRWGGELVARVAELEVGPGFALVVFAVAVLAVVALSVPLARTLRRREILLAGSGGFKGAISSPGLAWRKTLLGVQTALTAAGVTIGALAAADAVPRLLVPADFRSEDRYFLQVHLPAHLSSADAKADLLPRMQEALRGAGFAVVSPVDMPLLSSALALYGVEDLETGEIVPTQLNGTDHDLFQALEMPMVAGRAFSRQEYEERAPVMVVGTSLAGWLGGVEEAVGERLRFEDRTFEIVGVVPDVQNPILEIPGIENQAYVPFTPQDGPPTLSFVASASAGGEEPAAPAVVTALRDVEEQLFVGAYRPLSRFRDELLGLTRLKAALALFFVAAIVLLTIVCVRTLVSDTYRELSPLLVSHWAVGARLAHLRRLLTTRILRPTFSGLLAFLVLGIAAIYRLDLVAEPVRPSALAGVVGAGLAMALLVAVIARSSARRHIRSIFRSITNIDATNPVLPEVQPQ